MRATTAAAAKAEERLDGGTTLFAGAGPAGLDLADVRDLHLLTAKPFVYVFNEDDNERADEELRKRLAAHQEQSDHVLKRARSEKELLLETEGFALDYFVVWIEDFCDVLGMHFVLDSAVVIAVIERCKVE